MKRFPPSGDEAPALVVDERPVLLTGGKSMKTLKLSATLSLALMMSACASTGGMTDVARIQDPTARETAIAQLQAAAPKPLEGNGGLFMSPFTSDGVTAEWVTKAMKVQASGDIGGAVGQVAADQLLSNIPFAGLFAGKATKALARSAAMKSIGGEAFLKSSSDLSFNTLDDMAKYMYAFHSGHPEYARIVKATAAIYPEFATVYAVYPQTPMPAAAPKTAPVAATTAATAATSSFK